MSMRPGRNMNFDLRMRFGESCEKGRFQEGTERDINVPLHLKLGLYTYFMPLELPAQSQ